MNGAEALRKIRRWADFHAKGEMGDADMANAFLGTVREVPLAVADECLSALPRAAWPVALNMLAEFAQRDYYDDRHRYIMDGRTFEQRQEHYRQMQPHYRLVGERLLARLRAELGT